MPGKVLWLSGFSIDPLETLPHIGAGEVRIDEMLEDETYGITIEVPREDTLFFLVAEDLLRLGVLL